MLTMQPILILRFIGFDVFTVAGKRAFFQRATLVIAETAVAVLCHFVGEGAESFPVFDGFLADWQLQHQHEAFVVVFRVIQVLREDTGAAHIQHGAEYFASTGTDEFIGLVGRVLQTEGLHKTDDSFAAERAIVRRHDGEWDDQFRRFAAWLGRSTIFAAAEDTRIEAAGFAVMFSRRGIKGRTLVFGMAVLHVTFSVALAFDHEGDAGNGDEDDDGGGDAQ